MLVREMSAPPAGAGSLRATVPISGYPPTIRYVSRDIRPMPAGSTVSPVVQVTPSYVTDRCTLVDDVTRVVVTNIY
jgi:hypothetical protein